MEAAGLETSGMAISVSELREEIKALTRENVDIMDSTGNFRSTYEILQDISRVWKDINSVDRAALLELLAGKRNANVTASIITNFDVAEETLETSAQKSEGSAMAEYEAWLDSIQAKQQQFTAQFQSFSSALIDSDWIKDIIDFGTDALAVLTDIVDEFGSLQTVFTGLMAVAGFNNFAPIKWVTDYDDDFNRSYDLNLTRSLDRLGNATWRERGSIIGNAIIDGIVGQAAGLENVFEQGSRNAIEDLFTGFDPSNMDAFNRRLSQSQAFTESGRRTIERYARSNQNNINTLVRSGQVFDDLNTNIQAYNQGLINTHRSTKLAELGMSALTGVMNFAVSAAISVAITAIYNLITYEDRLIENSKRLVESFYETEAALQRDIDDVEDLRNEFDQLSRGVSDSGKNIGLSSDEFDRYHNIANQLAELSPTLVRGYDSERNAIIEKNGAIDETIAKLKEQIELEKAALLIDKNDITAGYSAQYSNAKEEIAKAETELQGLYDQLEQAEIDYNNMRQVHELNMAYYGDNGNVKGYNTHKEYLDQTTKEYEDQKASLELQINVQKQGIVGLENDLKRIVDEFQGSIGRAILEYTDGYSNLSDEAQTLVNNLSDPIKALVDPETYASEVKDLISEVTSITLDLPEEEIEKINNLFLLSLDELSYDELVNKLKDIPAEIRPKIMVSLGIEMREYESLYKKINQRVQKENEGLTSQFHAIPEEYLNQLTLNQLEVLTNPDFEITPAMIVDFEHLVEGIQKWFDDHKAEAKIAIDFDVSPYKTKIEEIETAYSSLSTVVNEYNTTGSVSSETLIDLLSISDDYLSYLEFSEQGLRLNTEALNDLIAAQSEQAAFALATNLYEQAKAAIEAGEAETLLATSIDGVADAEWDLLIANALALEGLGATTEVVEDLINKLNAIRATSENTKPKYTSSTDAWKDEFERYLSDLEFLRDTNKITEQQYYAELNRLNEKYFANNKKYLDDYRKYYVEVYDYLLQRQEDMLNAIADAATKALDKQIEAKDKEIAARQELIDAKRDEISALEEQYEKEDRLFELQKARDNYNKIAANKNTRLYTRDKGWIYTADPHALQEAKDKLDELEKENERAEAKEAIEDEIKALEEEIKVLEDEKEAIEALKDKWGEATDSIGQSLEEYMLDLELTTAFTKMSYEQMSNAVMQYAAIVNAVRGGKLYGNGLAGFENIYGAANTAPLYGLTNSVAASAPTVGGTTTGAANVKEEETNPNTGAGGKPTGIRAYIESKSSSNISKETDKETEELLKLNTDTEKNTSNTYDANVQLIRLEEDAFVMVEDSFIEQYDLSNALYNTTLEDLENAYDTNEGVWSIFELFETLMEEGIRGLGGGSGGGSSGIRGFIESGGLDGSGSSSGSSGKKSTHDRIAYADMNADQRARAERTSERLGIPVEEVKMYDVGENGLIIVGKDQAFTEDRQMVIKGWADKVADIDDDMRQEYRDTLEEQSKWDLTHVYATLSGKATGALSIGRRGLYNVDERGIETIVHPENGRVTWLEQGDRVYTANDTKRNYDMMDLFDRVDNLELLKKTVFDNPMEKIVASLNRMPRTNPVQAIPVNQTVERDSDIYISGCEFNMPNVTDRESFIKDLTRIAKYK